MKAHILQPQSQKERWAVRHAHDGSDAIFKYTTGSPIGDAGHGEIQLSNGASLDIGNAVLGNASSGQGSLLATSGAHFDITSLAIGVNGYGYFRLTTAASANVAGDLTVGQGTMGYGMFVVTGNSSDLNVAGAVTINRGNGDSEVSGGGKLEAGSLTIAGKAGMRPGLNISGGGSALSVDGAVVIGDAGNGTLTVTNNAQFTATNQTILVGRRAGAVGDLQLIDAAGDIGAGDLIVGDAGAGLVSIKGGEAHKVKNIILGKQKSGGGVLSVSDGGQLTAGDVNVGPKGDGDGVIVFNADSKFEAENLILGGLDPDPDHAEEQLCGTWVYKGSRGDMGVSDSGFATVTNSVTLKGDALKGDGTDSAVLAVATGGGMVIGGDGSRQPDQITIKANGEVTGHGLVTVGQETADGYSGTVVNDGTITAKDGILKLDASVSGTGTAHIADLATLEVTGSFSGDVVFDGGHAVLKLDQPDPSKFKGEIGSLEAGDTIHLDRADLPAALSHTEIRGSDLILTFDDGTSWSYKLDGAYSNGTFTIKDTDNDGSGNPTGVDITFQDASSQIRTGVSGAPTGNAFLDSLAWGWGAWAKGTTITYCFGSQAQVKDAVHAHGETYLLDCDSKVGKWSAAEEKAFKSALDLYSEVTGLHFREVGSATHANLTWWKSSNLGAAGVSEVPAQEADGQLWQFFDGAAPGWKFLKQGGYGFQTITHELGHALGLAHPHDGGAEPDRSTFPDARQDRDIFTVMSYRHARAMTGDPAYSREMGGQGGLGAFDIAALQALYGKNTRTRHGDTTYDLPHANHQGTDWTSIWDTGGKDTISAKGSSAGSIIDLQDAPLAGNTAGGHLSKVDGIVGGFTIAAGVDIENAIGGNGDDSMTGNDLDNTLQGGRGDDVLVGLGGEDILVGGAGADRFQFLRVSDSHAAGGEDTIRDFSRASKDTIDLSELARVGRLNFIAAEEFDGKSSEVRYLHEGGDTIVQIDTDSDKAADMEIVLYGNRLDMAKGDFIL
jgi:serralysin